MTKLNFNKATLSVTDNFFEYINFPVFRIIGGDTVFTDASYIGINSPFIVPDPTGAYTNGETPFITPNYKDTFNTTQIYIGDTDSNSGSPIIKISFNVSGLEEGTVIFNLIIDDELNTSTEFNFESSGDYVTEIGVGESIGISSASYISILLQCNRQAIEVRPYSLTMFCQLIKTL